MTGGIAEGKSTVLQWLKEDGFSVCSSDEAARSLLAQNNVRLAVAAIAGLPRDFEPQSLRSAMLADDEVRRGVNRYLHPLIGQVNRNSAADFFEIPLLIEACLYSDYDQIWVVTCDAFEQRRRLEARYGDAELVEALLRVQLTVDARCQFADVILRTNRPTESVRQELRSIVCAMKTTFLGRGR